jgi:hypothetical protein
MPLPIIQTEAEADKLELGNRRRCGIDAGKNEFCFHLLWCGHGQVLRLVRCFISSGEVLAGETFCLKWTFPPLLDNLRQTNYIILRDEIKLLIDGFCGEGFASHRLYEC